MSEEAELEMLLRLMPPGMASDTRVDWDRMAGSWGRRFPAGYRRFIEAYGSGIVQDYLVVIEPEPAGEPYEEPTDGMREHTAFARNMWHETRKTPELEGTTPQLITWGVDSSADYLCWDASDQDSDRWPVLVYNRGDSLWRRYDCGMVAFLVRSLRADFPDLPFGDVSFWGRGSASYVTQTEYMRRLKEGLDPWTGEPDPDAGVSG